MMGSTYHRLVLTLPLAVALALASLLGLARAAKPTATTRSPGMSQWGALGYAERGYDYRAILTHYYAGTGIGDAAAGQRVNVLLQGARRRVSLTGAGSANGQPLLPAVTYSVSPDGPDRVVLRGPHTQLVAATLSLLGPAGLRLKGLADNGLQGGLYRGSLVLRPAAGGGVDAIDAIDLEGYVRGVVSAEMPAGWPAAALDAQAVAARTYALTAHAGPGGEFDVYCDTRSQVYRGVAAETPSTNLAVVATAGQLVVREGHPIVTYYFAGSPPRHRRPSPHQRPAPSPAPTTPTPPPTPPAPNAQGAAQAPASSPATAQGAVQAP